MASGGDIVSQAVQPIGIPRQELRVGALRFLSPTKSLATQAGVKSYSVHPPSSAAANPLSTGSLLNIFVQPAAINPDLISKFIVEFRLQNTGAAPLTIANYAAMCLQQYTVQYGTSINQNNRAEVLALNSLVQYGTEELAVKGPQEGIVPATGAPATTVIAAGASVTFRVPLLTPFDGCLWTRSLGSTQIQFGLTWQTAASLVTVGAPADLLLAEVNVLANGYKFTTEMRAKLESTFAGTAHINRFLDLQASSFQMSSGITLGTQVSVSVGGSLFGLSAALAFWVRATPVTPATALTAIPSSINAFTFLLGSQPLDFLPPQANANFVRATFAGPEQIRGTSIFNQELNILPFTTNLSDCVATSSLLGSYFVSSQLVLQILCGATAANCELYGVTYNVSALVQLGANLTVQTT